MERVAEPLRAMGARGRDEDGHAPVRSRAAALARRSRTCPPVPSAQVKSADPARGSRGGRATTTVGEPAPTRDHTERALAALGAPGRRIERGGDLAFGAFQHDGFEGTVPGDPSSAAFLVAAAALTGSRAHDHGRRAEPDAGSHFLEVMERMGVRDQVRRSSATELGEPVGTIEVEPCAGLAATTGSSADELPLVIDEVPVLAALAAHAAAERGSSARASSA